MILTKSKLVGIFSDKTFLVFSKASISLTTILKPPISCIPPKRISGLISSLYKIEVILFNLLDVKKISVLFGFNKESSSFCKVSKAGRCNVLHSFIFNIALS